MFEWSGWELNSLSLFLSVSFFFLFPQYLLLLNELLKRSEECHALPPEALSDLISARDRISLIASSINSSLHHKENQLKVLHIQNKFERDARYQDLVTPTRCLVREGPLKKKYGKGTRHLSSSTTYHFFLFSDVLVYADISKNVMKGTTYKMKHILPINEMEVEAINSRTNIKTGTHARTAPKIAARWEEACCSACFFCWLIPSLLSLLLFPLLPLTPDPKGKNRDLLVSTRSGGVTKSFELSCADTEERDSWVDAFTETIDKMREEQQSLRTNTFDGKQHMDGNNPKLKAMMGV
jgi:hypothetical protein